MAEWRNGNRSDRSDVALDKTNQNLADSLSNKVSRLKSIAFDIENDTKEHNRLLDSMDGDFDGGNHLLSGSLNRIQKMMSAGRGNRRVMCYIAGGLVATFVVLYYLVAHVPWSS